MFDWLPDASFLSTGASALPRWLPCSFNYRSCGMSLCGREPSSLLSLLFLWDFFSVSFYFCIIFLSDELSDKLAKFPKNYCDFDWQCVDVLKTFKDICFNFLAWWVLHTCYIHLVYKFWNFLVRADKSPDFLLVWNSRQLNKSIAPNTILPCLFCKDKIFFCTN